MKLLRSLIAPFAVLPKRTAIVVASCEGLVALALWQWLSTGLVPGPVRVGVRMVELVTSASFIDDLLTSLGLTLHGMGLSAVIALLVAYASVIPITRPVAQFIVQTRYLTISGLVFLFTLLTSGGGQLKLTLLVFGIVPFFVTSMLGIIAEIKREEYDLCATLRMGPWRTLWEVIVLGRADSVLLVVSVNFAIAWMMITMVEGISMSQGGLGTLMIKSGKYIDLATVFAVLLWVMAVGKSADASVRAARTWLFPYTR